MTRTNTIDILVLLMVSVLMSTPLFLFAQTSTPTTTEDMPTVETPVTTTASPAPTARISLTPVAQTRLTNLAANISNRLDAYLRRFDNVATRLNSRMTKMEAEGKDVAAARATLASAETQLATARQTLASIDRDVAAFVGSDNPREAWARVKTTYTTSYTALAAAHADLKTVVTLLSDAGTIPPAETATSTVDTVTETE